MFSKKNKSNTQKVENVQTQSNKNEFEDGKNVSIADRGLKYNINKSEKEKNAWKFFSFISICSTICLSGLVYLFSTTTKMYVVDSNGAPVELKELPKLPFTEARVKTFTDEAISRIYGLNYRYVEEQLNSVKIYIASDTYDAIMNEMERSNYITALKVKKEIVTVTPTNTINKFKMLDIDNLIITRSFIREKISGDNIRREEIIYDVAIKRVQPTELHPWGLVVKSIKENSVREY